MVPYINSTLHNKPQKTDNNEKERKIDKILENVKQLKGSLEARAFALVALKKPNRPVKYTRHSNFISGSYFGRIEGFDPAI